MQEVQEKGRALQDVSESVNSFFYNLCILASDVMIAGYSIPRFFLPILFACTVSVSTHAQDQHRISTSLGMNRLDFWHEAGYAHLWNRWEVQAGVGYGVNRTLFQGRSYPRVTLGGTFYALHKPRFSLGPTLIYGYSTLKYSKADNARVSWHDCTAGIKWSFGQRWRIGQVVSAGYIGERYFSTVYDRKMTAGNWVYYTTIFVSYGW